jgi:predicted ATPase/DNA-binding XRE family transcriptional regulator
MFGTGGLVEQPYFFGEWLRRRRRALDWTQEELAKQAGCAVGTIRKIEAEELRPSKQLAEILAQRLDIPPKDREDFVRFARGVLRDASPTLPFVEETASLAPTRRDAKPTHNLPAQLTSFIGREREMADVKRLLVQSRLVTLTGSGGCGKTRLAIQVTADLIEEFPDGVWFVQLVPLSDSTLVPQSVATTLGLYIQQGRPMLTILTDYLGVKSLMLILDNCEHLLDTCAQLADTLLHACPNLRILASSREPLGIAGENTFRVPSLTLPDLQHLPTPREASLAQSEAVRLFVERAVAVQPSFRVTDANALAVVQICHRLDGIPLAIELAAARTKALSIEEIVRRLDDRFRLLTGGSRTALPRHQTLRALIDWSYGLLSEPERVVLRRLSVFAGGWTLEATETVCADEPIDSGQVLDLLTHLVDKSLVVMDERGKDTRYRMLETIRQYARDKLLESGEGEQVREKHLGYFVQLAETAEQHLTSADQIPWFNRLEAEHDNLRAAAEWAIGSSAVSGLRMIVPLEVFCSTRGYWSEWRERLTRLMSQTEEMGKTTLHAQALYVAGRFARWEMDLASARSITEQCLAISKELNAKRIVAFATHSLGTLERLDGNYALARLHYEASLALFQEIGAKRGIVISLHELAAITPDNEQDRAFLEQSLEIARELGSRRPIGIALFGLGILALRERDYTKARALFEQALNVLREIDNKPNLVVALDALAQVMVDQGEYESARAVCEESLMIGEKLVPRPTSTLILLGRLELYQDHTERAVAHLKDSISLLGQRKDPGARFSLTLSLDGLAEVCNKKKQPGRAVRLLSAVEGLQEHVGDMDLVFVVNPENHNRNIAAAREQLGDTAFNAAWSEGNAMTMEQAIEYALAE